MCRRTARKIGEQVHGEVTAVRRKPCSPPVRSWKAARAGTALRPSAEVIIAASPTATRSLRCRLIATQSRFGRTRKPNRFERRASPVAARAGGREEDNVEFAALKGIHRSDADPRQPAVGVQPGNRRVEVEGTVARLSASPAPTMASHIAVTWPE